MHIKTAMYKFILYFNIKKIKVMKTIEIKLYKFSELPEEAKEKAIEKLSNINVDYNWWEGVYEDAEQIGLKLTGFDIGRGNYCEGELQECHTTVAENILEQHGKDCETYKTAKSFLDELNELTGQHENIEDCPEDEIENLENNFLQSLLEDYRIMLQQEYEYRTSTEVVTEMIEANDYDFTEDGEIY